MISGNTGNGVVITGSGTTGNVVAGNIIGLNAAGTEAILGDVAWYKFQGTFGDTTQDSVGNDGRCVSGDCGSYVAGKVGNGILMIGTGLVTTPLTVDPSTGATFDAPRASFPTGTANGAIAADDGGDATQRGMGLFVAGGDLVLSGSNGSGTFNFAITGPSVNDGAFHHVAATWTGDTTTDGVKLYLNGALVGQATAASSIATGSQTFAMGNGFSGVLDGSTARWRRPRSARISNAGSQGQGLGNHGDGVAIDTSASANTIGGATASARNVISGNLNGVVIVGATSTGNVVQGDYIGTDLTGMTAFGNSVDGIVSEGTSGLIGGATDDGQGNPSPGTAPGNLIAGSAVNLYLAGASDVVAGNLVGLTASGTAPLCPGTIYGVVITGTDNTLGGLSPNDRNIITGDSYAVYIETAGPGNQVLNNYVGTDPTGTIGLEHIGNTYPGYSGILVYNSGPRTVIGSPGAGNLIADTA